MIFIAVGTQKFQFNRLLAQVDELVQKEIICEEVFAQVGHSSYLPETYEYKTFLTKEVFEEKCRMSDLIICHSGVATIMSGLRHNKPIIVVPRLAKYQEHVDDHQIEIAEAFAEAGYILMCKEYEELADKIELSRNIKYKQYVSQREKVVSTIFQYLSQI